MASKQQQRNARGAGPDARPTKAERRQIARRQREELRRRAERQRRTRRIASLAVIGVAIAGGVWLFTPGDDGPAKRTGPLPGLMTGTGPWPNNSEQLSDRLDELDLPPAGAALHIHSHLSLFVDGEQVPVPGDIGIGAEHAPLHSHDQTGVMHIESANAGSTFTLGDYFDVWGLRLSSECLGGRCAEGERSLHVFVDGQRFTGDPRTIELADEQLITIAYGTEDDVPDPLPTYDWSQLQA